MRELDNAAVLLIDDDEASLLSLSKALRSVGLEARLHIATNAKVARDLAARERPQVAVLDLCLEEMEGVESGLSLLRELVALDRSMRIIVLTGHASTENGVRALSIGAASFVDKPANTPHLMALIRDGIKQSDLRRTYETLKEANSAPTLALVAHSDAMKKVMESAQQAARTNQSVLILGETGTGKGLLAQAIHNLSDRASKKFVRFQPGPTSQELLGSELFGHKKGAFTGALEDRKGLFQEAHLGTFFLDEIAELPPSLQVALLGVLQDKKFRPLGVNHEIEGDFRLISATNKSLRSLVSEKIFREDLYYRVCQLAISLPPLRERKADILPLAQHFLNTVCRREQLNVFEIDPKAIQKLQNYKFPGNIRELEHIIESAAFQANYQRHTVITPEHVELDAVTHADAPVSNGQSLTDKLEAVKMKLINEELDKHQGNVNAAARSLGVGRQVIRTALLKSHTRDPL